MSQNINSVPHGFGKITMRGENFSAVSRAKDAMILPAPGQEPAAEQQLCFYDCNCGHIRQLPGRVVEQGEERLVFEVSPGKRFILEKLSRPGRQ